MRDQQTARFRLARVVMLIALVALASCATKSPYVDPGSVTQTTKFSDTDLRMNAEAMVTSLLEASFLDNLEERPILATSGIQNRTMQHIDTESIESTIQTALLKSGQFRFVDRTTLQQAAQEQALVSLQRIDVADAVKLGEAIGADYFLLGQLAGMDNQHGRQSVHYTKLAMRLVDVRSTEVVWLDEKEIKKASQKSFFK